MINFSIYNYFVSSFFRGLKDKNRNEIWTLAFLLNWSQYISKEERKGLKFIKKMDSVWLLVKPPPSFEFSHQDIQEFYYRATTES